MSDPNIEPMKRFVIVDACRYHNSGEIGFTGSRLGTSVAIANQVPAVNYRYLKASCTGGMVWSAKIHQPRARPFTL